MGNGQGNHRQGKRVEYHFIVRVRPVGPPGAAAWDVSTIRNISKTGLMFYSSIYYDYNTDVEVRATNPITSNEIVCIGKVVRCELLKGAKEIYSIAVEMTKMSPQDREVYDKTVKLFVDRSDRPK